MKKEQLSGVQNLRSISGDVVWDFYGQPACDGCIIVQFCSHRPEIKVIRARVNTGVLKMTDETLLKQVKCEGVGSLIVRVRPRN